jgi:hypothetical protein
MVTLKRRPPIAIPVLIPLGSRDLRDRVPGRERTLRHIVDADELEDVIQAQTRMECLWKYRQLKPYRFEGVAEVWYADELIWPNARTEVGGV